MAKRYPWLGLAGFVAVCFGVAGVGAAVTTPNIPTWYSGLAKPAWNPPSWIFGPVWSTLYLCMAVAAWLVWRQSGRTVFDKAVSDRGTAARATDGRVIDGRVIDDRVIDDRAASPSVRVPLGLFALQLLLNAAWSWLFFGLHSPGAALVDVVLLWAAIVATMVAFWRCSTLAGILLIPYLLWVSFATVLNFAIWRLNA